MLTTDRWRKYWFSGVEGMLLRQPGRIRIRFVSCFHVPWLGDKPVLKKGGMSATLAREPNKRERVRPRIRLMGRLLGPLATVNFPSGLQAQTGPDKGVRWYITVGAGCVWIWDETGGYGQTVRVCVSLYLPPMANSTSIRIL